MSTQILRKKIRVRKEDAALVYHLIESHEGIASYSTLEGLPGDAHRDLELQIPIGFQDEVNDLLQRLGELIYELDSKGT